MPSIKPRTETVLLYQGDDRDKIAELLADVEVALADPSPRRMNTPAPGTTELEAYNAFLAEAETRAVRCVLSSIGRAKWRDLLEEHTTTKTIKVEDAEGNKFDREISETNDRTFADAVVPLALVEPAFGSDAERQAFLDELNDADFSLLYSATARANVSSGVVDPKALNVSALTQPSDET